MSGSARQNGRVTDLDQQRDDDGATVGEVESADIPHGSPKKRRFDRGLLVASLVISAGVALIVWGLFSAITGDEGVDRPVEIESVEPVENAVQVLQQERIAVDLEFGYEAVLIIDGVELETTDVSKIPTEPGQQRTLPETAIYDSGNAVISFTPVEGAAVDQLTEGRHSAKVIYWKTVEGRDNARSYSWSFVVV